MASPGKRGRLAQYANSAERARAWRQRQKEVLASALAAAEAKPTEQVVSVEPVVEKAVLRPQKRGQADAQRVIRLARERLTGSRADEAAKRFRANAARVATTTRDLLAVLNHPTQGSRLLHQDDKAFLLQVAEFFSTLNSGFEAVQQKAKRARDKAQADRDAEHQKRMADVVAKTLGPAPALDEALAMVKALLQFDHDGSAWIASRRGVDKGHTAIWNGPALSASYRTNDIQRMCREVAEARLEMGERGHLWKDEKGSHYTAGWADFEEYRSYVNQ